MSHLIFQFNSHYFMFPFKIFNFMAILKITNFSYVSNIVSWGILTILQIRFKSTLITKSIPQQHHFLKGEQISHGECTCLDQIQLKILEINKSTVAETKFKLFSVLYSRNAYGVNQGLVDAPRCRESTIIHNSDLQFKSRWQLEQQSLYCIPTLGRRVPFPFKYTSQKL